MSFVMPKLTFGSEQIVTLLSQTEEAVAEGNAIVVAWRDDGVSDQSYA